MRDTLIILVFEDGATYSGPDEVSLVEALRDAGRFTQGKTVEEYMQGYAHRARLLFHDDPVIQTDSAVNFLMSIAKTPEVRILIVTNVIE